jgi:hypothetical protein
MGLSKKNAVGAFCASRRSDVTGVIRDSRFVLCVVNAMIAKLRARTKRWQKALILHLHEGEN